RARPEGFDPYRKEGWKVLGGTLEGLMALVAWGVDVVFPVLHGRFGEDGTLQACLRAAGVPFVGSASLASALANDKVRAKEVFRFHGIPTPDFEVLTPAVRRRHRLETGERLAGRLGLPLVLKDPCGGSSLEVRVAEDVGAVATAIQDLVEPSGRLLVEAFVPGRELTAGVLDVRGHRGPTALPIVEIRPRGGGTFDYHEKYSADGAAELCPAPLDQAAERRARELGLAVHVALGLEGLSRTDLILTEDGSLSVLEVNTLPGMTQRGLVPKAAQVAGFPFPALVEILVRGA
ncbi:MAG: D-alanine--D-alanine ligase, partial [Planctomycetota bacterium]